MDSSSPEPGPQELPRAVVAYLLQGAKVTEEVYTRCLLALADDGWLRIEPQDSGPPTVRLAKPPEGRELRPYEQVALDRVVKRTGTMAHVPLSALTSDEGEDFAPWWKRFGEVVREEAAAAGLVSKAITGLTACLIPLGLGAAILTAVALAAPSILAVFYVGVVAVAVTAAIGSLAGRPRLTSRGRAAAEWWRQHGGGLGGTVIADQIPPGAIPSTHTPESLVAQGSAPLPDGYVWSSYGDRWHMVKVGSTSQPTWGRPATAVVMSVFGLFFTIPAAAIGRILVGGGLGTLMTAAPVTIAGSLLLFTWLPAYRRLRVVPTRAVFTGQVVKRWTYESDDEDSTTNYCCCIDDGTAAEALAFKIDSALHRKLRVGDVVTVDFNPRRHTVRRIEPITLAPGPR